MSSPTWWVAIHDPEPTARIEWDHRLGEPICGNCLLKVTPERHGDRLRDPTHCLLCGSAFTNAIR